MKNISFRVLLTAICVASILASFTKVTAGPVRFDQVVQIVDARPGKAASASLTRLAIAGDYSSILVSEEDDDDKKTPQQQDGRVITETRSQIELDDDCECVAEDVYRRGFPKWALLGLAAIPAAFILIRRRRDTPTPTPTIPIGETPTLTPTPPMTQTPTPTPPVTPTPPPEPVPEPITLLLFGTGLASVGLAARRRFGKKGESKEDDKEE